ncbi:MAG: Pyridoxal biosynthesis lyase PdxS [Candidatus Methanolliviera sp. GoM_oil]|nr:MAG: Pyridoxal biosynthesis lyase PdxS [Candidatus Methanolliviera sp. GoM_oil]
MVRTKGEAGTGDVKEAVRHMKIILGEIRSLKGKDEEELHDAAKRLVSPYEIVFETARLQRLPVVNFAAGGIATPADAALMMKLGADGIFVGSGIFKSEDPQNMANAIVEAVNNYDNPSKLAEISKGLSGAMKGIDVGTLSSEEMLQTRGM